MNFGFQEAHKIHQPDSRCACKNGYKMYHDHYCEWAKLFMMEYSDMDDVEEYLDSKYYC